MKVIISMRGRTQRKSSEGREKMSASFPERLTIEANRTSSVVICGKSRASSPHVSLHSAFCNLCYLLVLFPQHSTFDILGPDDKVCQVSRKLELDPFSFSTVGSTDFDPNLIIDRLRPWGFTAFSATRASSQL